MRFNVLFFIILFFVFSFFITINLFFERSFQKEFLDLSHKELGLLTQNLAEKLDFILGIVPQKYDSLSDYLKAHPDRSIKIDRDFLRSFFVRDLEALTGLKVDLSYSPERVKTEDIFRVEIDFEGRNIIYHMPFNYNGQKVQAKIQISLDEIFQKHLKPIRLIPRGHAWLISKDGTLVYHPTQPGMIGNNIYSGNMICFKCHKSFEAEKMILRESIGAGYHYYYSPEKLDKVIYYAGMRVRDQAWILCVSIPYEELLSAINKSMKLHSLIVISIFLSMIILGTLFYYINTKRIAAEEKLRVYALLESIIESTQSKIVVMDKNYKIVLANTPYANLLKRSRDEILGINFFEICPQQIESYRVTLKDLIDKAFQGEFGELMGYPLKENGETKYYHITVNPLKEGSQINGAVLTCDDVTAEITLREKIQEYASQLEKLVAQRTEELETEKEKLSIIMGTVNSGICLIDEEGSITWMNSKMEEILKLYKNKQITDKINICELFSKIGDCLNAPDSTQFVQEIFSQGQRKIFQVQITPFRTGENKVNYICLIQDITDLKLMEERIMQSEKLQALARISAGLAHEIGNPLTSISSYVQVLKEMDLGDFANQALEVISKHILRISEIIRNISSFAKPSRGEVFPTRVSEVLEGSLSLVKFDKRMKDIKINLNLKEVPEVLVDPNQLSQVFINLILNAGDAMPEGGELTIETKEEDGFVLISFRDTGIGIPPENLPHIFDPFFTTKEKGTGFGLSVSYSIIKNFGGDILVESEVGKGSTFTVKLPRYKSQGSSV
jgi:PAS domain S-box-containing protein